MSEIVELHGSQKEFLTIVYAINKFRHYITCYPIFVHTDHFSVNYLMNKSVTNNKITRWLITRI